MNIWTDKKILSALLVIVLALIFIICACHLNFGLWDENEQVEASIPYEDEIPQIFVHFIDVGQGDCSVVQTPYGNILIDAGTPESEYEIEEYIDSLNIHDFKYAIFSHPHSDHIGSAAYLLEKYNFGCVILPDAVTTSYFYSDLLDAIEKENCTVILGEAGQSFELGEVLIDIFAPRDYYYKDDLNDISIVAKITFGSSSFLFAGDAENFSERQMLKYDCNLKSNVLKVAHHGSSTSSTPEFVEAVSPDIAIISAGKDNDYGHPHRETRALLDEIDAEVYITYNCGTVVVSTDGTVIKTVTEK